MYVLSGTPTFKITAITLTNLLTHKVNRVVRLRQFIQIDFYPPTFPFYPFIPPLLLPPPPLPSPHSLPKLYPIALVPPENFERFWRLFCSDSIFTLRRQAAVFTCSQHNFHTQLTFGYGEGLVRGLIVEELEHQGENSVIFPASKNTLRTLNTGEANLLLITSTKLTTPSTTFAWKYCGFSLQAEWMTEKTWNHTWLINSAAGNQLEWKKDYNHI